MTRNVGVFEAIAPFFFFFGAAKTHTHAHTGWATGMVAAKDASGDRGLWRVALNRGSVNTVLHCCTGAQNSNFV